MTEQQLTHIDEHGDVRMVDVSQKADTERVAVAEGFISMKPETLALIVEGKCWPARAWRASWPPSRRAASSPCATR